MPITKDRKDELVATYTDLLERSDGFIIVQFADMSVASIDQLRAKVRGADGHYAVAKNTLLTKALQQKGWPVPDDLLKGPTAVVFGLDNMPGVAKAVLEFTNEKAVEERVRVKGGVLTGDILTAKQIDTVSKLPSLDELRAQLAGLIVAPAQGLVNILYGATGQVVNVLQAYTDKEGAA